MEQFIDSAFMAFLALIATASIFYMVALRYSALTFGRNGSGEIGVALFFITVACVTSLIMAVSTFKIALAHNFVIAFLPFELKAAYTSIILLIFFWLTRGLWAVAGTIVFNFVGDFFISLYERLTPASWREKLQAKLKKKPKA